MLTAIIWIDRQQCYFFIFFDDHVTAAWLGSGLGLVGHRLEGRA